MQVDIATIRTTIFKMASPLADISSAVRCLKDQGKVTQGKTLAQPVARIMLNILTIARQTGIDLIKCVQKKQKLNAEKYPPEFCSVGKTVSIAGAVYDPC